VVHFFLSQRHSSALHYHTTINTFPQPFTNMCSTPHHLPSAPRNLVPHALIFLPIILYPDNSRAYCIGLVFNIFYYPYRPYDGTNIYPSFSIPTFPCFSFLFTRGLAFPCLVRSYAFSTSLSRMSHDDAATVPATVVCTIQSLGCIHTHVLL
jgi:hypothetical protein